LATENKLTAEAEEKSRPIAAVDYLLTNRGRVLSSSSLASSSRRSGARARLCPGAATACERGRGV